MKKLSVFYRKEMNVMDNTSFCLNAEKPGLFVEAASKMIDVISDWDPLTIDEICVSHDERHVRRVLSGDQNNGYGNNLKSIADSLPWESASFYNAALYALKNGIAMSPTVGFHHADYKECWNFCSFNGLTISAILMKQRGQAEKIGIIDFDCHYGNGTDSIIEKLNLDYITHYTFGQFKRTVRKGIGFDKWLEDLPLILEDKFKGSDILYYQAGVDAHIEDRFGGEITTEQMILRDQIVFRFAKNNNIPIVWNLAGGYQDPIDKIINFHLTTVLECKKIYFGE